MNDNSDTRSPGRLGSRLTWTMRVTATVYLISLVALIIGYKAAFLRLFVSDPFFVSYGVIVVAFILLRFLLSLFYRPSADHQLTPTVAIIMPSFNEGEAIAHSLGSLLKLNYPPQLLELIAVNDGSSDDTLEQIQRVAARADGRIKVINFPENRGKRAAMAAGIRASDADIVAFVDSDSVLDADALYYLVQGFAHPRVGAVAGHATTLNMHDSWIARMQEVRYYVAFRVIKAAESVFGAVTCCSGCFSAYRRQAILPHLEWWETQSFLGRAATFGDDRSLTNCVLRDWRVIYESRALSRTIVPAHFRTFMLQQVRWKRSWTRESLILSSFVWKKNPFVSLSNYVAITLPLLAPIAAVRALLWRPIEYGVPPITYLVGLYAMALVYGMYYAVRQREYDGTWMYGVGFVFFYLAFLVWQTYYAILTARRNGWGTRPSKVSEEASS